MNFGHNCFFFTKNPSIYRKKISVNKNFQTSTEVHFKQINGIQTVVTINENGEKYNVEDGGNGRLDAVSNALASHFGKPCDIFCYEEHSLKKGSDSSAIAYVGITGEDGKNYFGIGIDHDIIRASIDALESAMNRSLEA